MIMIYWFLLNRLFILFSPFLFLDQFPTYVFFFFNYVLFILIEFFLHFLVYRTVTSDMDSCNPRRVFVRKYKAFLL